MGVCNCVMSDSMFLTCPTVNAAKGVSSLILYIEMNFN